MKTNDYRLGLVSVSFRQHSTKEILEANGVKVVSKLIKPWRFDKARNESLKLVPKNTDICVCTDLDELFEPGWRKIIDEKWTPDTNLGYYHIQHNANRSDEVANISSCAKIHDRKNFYWKWIVHEYIVQKDPKQNIKTVDLTGLLLRHFPDLTKTRNYKKLLETAVKQSKHDVRYLGLLAEEYINSKEFKKADKYASQVLKEKKSTTYDICFAYKTLIKSALAKNKYEDARQLCYEALSKCDYCKIFYGELGSLYISHLNDNELGIAFMKKCLSINNDIVVAREVEWNNKAYCYNFISIGYYNLHDYENALKYVDIAISLDSAEVYLNNKLIYESMIKN